VSSRWPDKTVIGITGNIATGKSVVRRMLEHLDAFGIDADGLAHRAMSPGAPAYQRIVDTFGKWILDPGGKIDREKLGNVVFSSPDALAQLEAITHPIVEDVIDLLIRRAGQKVIVIEAIKLFESGLADDCDAVWVVDVSVSAQLQRLMQHRKLSEPAAKMRIAAQPSQAEKVAKASVIIDNSGNYESTFDQVQKHFRDLVGEVEPPPEPEPVPEPERVPGEVQITIKRGSPRLAEAIATFLNQQLGKSLTRTDVMHRFGEKAYMLAYAGDALVGLGGCQVENLIARTDEFLLASDGPTKEVVGTLIDTIEKAANALQAEISLIFLPSDTPDEIRKAVLAKGYERQTLDDLRIPDWREAAQESTPPNSYMVVKRLREDRVLRPI
jgi:dephospho-CoA kinase